MPHITVDLGGGIDAEASMEEFFDCLIEAYSKADALVPENVKLRANIFDKARVAGKPGQFIHINVALMRGPSKEQQAALSQLLWDAAANFFQDVDQISVEVREMEPATYRKRLPAEGM